MADKSNVTHHVIDWARDARSDDPDGKAAEHHRLQLLRCCWRELVKLLRWQQKRKRNTAKVEVWHMLRRALTVLIALRRHKDKGYVDALASGEHMGSRLWRREVPGMLELRKWQYEQRRSEATKAHTAAQSHPASLKARADTGLAAHLAAQAAATAPARVPRAAPAPAAEMPHTGSQGTLTSILKPPALTVNGVSLKDSQPAAASLPCYE
jgi:hypothetical protein